MADSKATVPTTQAAKKGSAENIEAQLIGRIAKLWADYDKRSLPVRKKTGSLLNARLGEPTKRQGRDRSVVDKVAEELHIAVSEINRMRWYAHFSKDEKYCWGDTPLDDRTWTRFKKRLPGLIAARKGSKKIAARNGNEDPAARKGDEDTTARNGNEGPAACNGNEQRQRNSGGKKKPAVIDGFLRFVSSATSVLNTDNFTVDGQIMEVFQRLEEFASAVSKTFGVRFTLETDQNGSHGLNKTEATPDHETSLTLSQCPLDAVAV